MEKSIENLRIRLRALNMVFETVMFLRKASSSTPSFIKMQTLRQFAFDEIEKEKPDLAKIYLLLSEMERECEKVKQQPHATNT